MKKHYSFSLIGALVSGLLILSACSSAAPAQPPEPTAVPQPTLEAALPVTGPEIQHHTSPSELPAKDLLAFGDQDTSKYADKKVAPDGDRFPKDLFERPFNANTMDTYYPYLDIQQVAVFQDADWYYGTLQLKGPDEAQAFPATYGFELDLNADGRGEFLILASAPVSGEWSVAGVKVYHDGNNDVGSDVIPASTGPRSGDGFEEQVFNQGEGGDPDTAWSRLVDPNTIQIAFKRTLLGGDDKFMISGWAGMDQLNPALFDLKDHFTHEQAGAADPGFPLFYPIKEVEKLDNTCWMTVGFAATGAEPGLCPTIIPKDAPIPPAAPPPVQIYIPPG